MKADQSTNLMKNKTNIILDLCVLVAGFILFGSIFVLKINSDLQSHIEHLQFVIQGEVSPLVNSNFLFYLTVYTLAFFQNNKDLLSLASSITLALALAAKFHLTHQFLDQQQSPNEKKISNLWLILGSLAMLLVFSLPTPNFLITTRYYIGQIPPNIWHNSTTILLMPFAIMLFLQSFNQFSNPTTRGIVILTILIALNLAAKPSFFFVFCLVYPLMLLIQFKLSKQFWRNMIPVFIGLALLALQYYVMYQVGYRIGFSSKRDVMIAFLAVWTRYTPNIPLSLLASLVFPITYLVGYPKDVLQNRLVQYSGLCFLASLAIFCTLAETEPYTGHGNFLWQAVVCSYLLFMVLLAQFLAKLQQSGLGNWKNRIILAAFSLHVISGILYLIKFFVMKDFP